MLALIAQIGRLGAGWPEKQRKEHRKQSDKRSRDLKNCRRSRDGNASRRQMKQSADTRSKSSGSGTCANVSRMRRSGTSKGSSKRWKRPELRQSSYGQSGLKSLHGMGNVASVSRSAKQPEEWRPRNSEGRWKVMPKGSVQLRLSVMRGWCMKMPKDSVQQKLGGLRGLGLKETAFHHHLLLCRLLHLSHAEEHHRE
jgi:hypothetical protein